jgi:hypothetical protein
VQLPRSKCDAIGCDRSRSIRWRAYVCRASLATVSNRNRDRLSNHLSAKFCCCHPHREMRLANLILRIYCSSIQFAARHEPANNVQELFLIAANRIEPYRCRDGVHSGTVIKKRENEMMRTKIAFGVGGLALLAMIGFQIATASNSPTNERMMKAAGTAPKSCCASAAAACCEGPMYCPHTGKISETCCCDVVDGKWVCRETGAVSEECCCVPASQAPQTAK